MNEEIILHEYYTFTNCDNKPVIMKWNKNVPVKKLINPFRLLPAMTFIKADRHLIGKTLYVQITKYMKPITEEEALLEI